MTDVPSLAAPASPGGAGLDTSRLASHANLEKAGKQFEAVFASMMIKSMRAAKLADDDLFGSKALDTFREMQDGKFAQAIADHAPLGIGKALTDFLAKSKAAEGLGAPATAPAEGGAP